MNMLIEALRNVRTPTAPHRVQREHPLQKSIIAYLTIALPHDAVITAIDHSDASPAARRRKASMGVLEGIADVLITWCPDPAARLHVIVWLECKTPKGRLRPCQEVWRDVVQASGAYWLAPRSLDDVVAFLATTPIPLRRVALL